MPGFGTVNVPAQKTPPLKKHPPPPDFTRAETLAQMILRREAEAGRTVQVVTAPPVKRPPPPLNMRRQDDDQDDERPILCTIQVIDLKLPYKPPPAMPPVPTNSSPLVLSAKQGPPISGPVSYTHLTLPTILRV